MKRRTLGLGGASAHSQRAAPVRRVGAATPVLGTLWCGISHRRSRRWRRGAPARGGDERTEVSVI